MKLHSILLPWILLIAWPSCQGEAQQAQITDCPEEMVCTEQFVTIQLQVTDANNKVVLLDSYMSKNVDTGQLYKLEQETEPSSTNGYYPVLTDSQLDDIKQEGSRILFTGIKAGQEVVSETLLIGHDCCHVAHREGKLSIQLPSAY